MSTGLCPTVTFKTCFRCGREFRAAEGSRVCSDCRKPKSTDQSPGCRSLSLREKQIVALVSQAKANKEIAHQLHLTEGTIKEYLNRLFKKMGARNRTELAIWALTRSVTSPAEGELAPVGSTQ